VIFYCDSSEFSQIHTGEAGTLRKTHKRAFQPKAYATGNERCPVRLFKKFKSHRPSEMNKVDSPFFLAIKHKQAPDDNTWYMKCPLGKNQIGKFPSTTAKNAALPQVSGAKVTNHSVRKTSISRLLDADMPENFVAQHSGHKSTESLQSYKSAGKKQQWQMSWVLSRVSSLDNTTMSTLSSPTPSFLQMCQPNNQTSCTSFNTANES
jgi:integrase